MVLNWIYFFLGIVLLLFGLLQVWFRIIKQKEINEAYRLVKELTDKNTPKLSKEEQYKIIDGNCNWEKIKSILNQKEIELSVLNYFIDIQPDEYLEYLKKHNPPSSWKEDTYGEVEIKKGNDSFDIIYYNHGKRISINSFKDYEKLLKFLVYERLTKIGYKYKKLLKKDYYT
jgi:hypothetical protein